MIRKESKLTTDHGKGGFEEEGFGNAWLILSREEIPVKVRER